MCALGQGSLSFNLTKCYGSHRAICLAKMSKGGYIYIYICVCVCVEVGSSNLWEFVGISRNG